MYALNRAGGNKCGTKASTSAAEARCAPGSSEASGLSQGRLVGGRAHRAAVCPSAAAARGALCPITIILIVSSPFCLVRRPHAPYPAPFVTHPILLLPLF